jgi:uncharacterized protein
MRLSGLFIYPVKSLRGIRVVNGKVDTLGLLGDRRFLIVDEAGAPLTQRALPRMAQVETALTDSDLVLRASGVSSCAIPRRTTGPSSPRTVSVWQSTNLIADDCGDDPAKWLEAFLGVSCRLVRIGEQFRRPVLSPRSNAHDIVTFADAFPFLVTSEASLSELNDRLVAKGEEPIPMDRFRPNLVVSDCTPFEEDTWRRVQIGEVTFRAGGPCSRCIMTTTDQLTGERGKEPLRTLSTYRRDATNPSDINFGQNLIQETKSGSLAIGDLVQPL